MLQACRPQCLFLGNVEERKKRDDDLRKNCEREIEAGTGRRKIMKKEDIRDGGKKKKKRGGGKNPEKMSEKI